ncbi:MAG: metallophosphoesterase [Kiritimatiellae bacterium]|nr:metallophosphoesterase [Kiritimatiellia bacterium]
MSGICRREFLGLGAGFLGLPAFGVVTNMTGRMEPISSPVVQPWNYGVLRVKKLELKVGAERPFRAVHFSDTHINFSDIEEMYESNRNYAAGVRRYVRFPQAIPSFYATLDYAASKPDTLLVNTGDLIDFGTRASYNFLRHNLKGREILFAIGNHEYERADSSYDTDIALRRRRLAESGLPQNFEFSSWTVNGVNFVAFDNAIAGKGRIAAETRLAIEREFDKGLPVVLMCHVPPYLSNAFRESAVQGKVDYALQQGYPQDVEIYLARSRKERWIGDEETVAFWRMIREKDNFKAVLCGHCHWPWDEPFGRGRLCMAGGNFEGCLNEIVFS